MHTHHRLAMVVPIAGLIAVLASAPTAWAKPKPTTTTTTTTVPTTTTTEPPTTTEPATTTIDEDSTGEPATSGVVNYSPLYWELLDRYASVEASWAPIRGVYGTSPECALAQQQGEPVACPDIVVIMNPDGTFGTGWVEDPAAPDGWREMLWTDCITDTDLWLCWM